MRFGGPWLAITWMLPGHHAPQHQSHLIALDEFRGNGKQGGISRGKAGVMMQLIKDKKIRELLLSVAVYRA